jgi:adenine phosphoribosyltransferase
MDIKKYIRDIPDFPKKGILFHDISTLFQNREAVKYVLKELSGRYKDQKIDCVVGIEARGFILGAMLSEILDCAFVMIRKPGKLPAETISEEYELEYGSDTVEIHKDALKRGDKVLLVDDLVATGGTILAGIRLIEKLGAEIKGVLSIIDMPDLGGRMKLLPYNYQYIVEYRGH